MSYYRRFYPFLRPSLPLMVASAALVVGVAVVNLSLLRLAGRLWDVITVRHDRVGMAWTLALFLGLVLLQGLLSMGHSYLTARASQRILADFRTHLFGHLQRLSLSFFAKR